MFCCTVHQFHAEVDIGADPPEGDPRHYSTFLASRPRKMENEAIKVVIEKCQKYQYVGETVWVGSGLLIIYSGAQTFSFIPIRHFNLCIQFLMPLSSDL